MDTNANLVRASVLIGGSIVGKAFTQAVIEAISRVSERPIFFALSNPAERGVQASLRRLIDGPKARGSISRRAIFSRAL